MWKGSLGKQKKRNNLKGYRIIKIAFNLLICYYTFRRGDPEQNNRPFNKRNKVRRYFARHGIKYPGPKALFI